MMPDGADPCEGYQQLQRELAAMTAQHEGLRKALEARNKQLGVACLKHDLTHSLACGHCFAELRKDADRYRWIRTAGAWESEIGMDILSENPSLFDAAVDAAMG
jgi:hypothetical protein